MRIIKSFFIAFSMYSKIPMPQFAWKDEDMRYALCFFPWVGAVIGVLWYLWKWIVPGSEWEPCAIRWWERRYRF